MADKRWGPCLIERAWGHGSGGLHRRRRGGGPRPPRPRPIPDLRWNEDGLEYQPEYELLVVDEVPLDRLWHAVPSFRTASEVWLRLLEAYGL